MIISMTAHETIHMKSAAFVAIYVVMSIVSGQWCGQVKVTL